MQMRANKNINEIKMPLLLQKKSKQQQQEENKNTAKIITFASNISGCMPWTRCIANINLSA